MRFSNWIVERNQRDATKAPKRRTNLELHRRAVGKRTHEMQHGRAGTMDTDRTKGSKGSRNRDAIDKSSREE
jgi:hypothetical protein